MTDSSQDGVPEDGADIPVGLPQVTPEQAAQAAKLAAVLDPDLAQAIVGGNAAVIAAVTSCGPNPSNDLVVERLLAMGVPPSACPPGVAQLIAERKAVLEKEELASEKRTAAGLAAMAAMAGITLGATSAEAGRGGGFQPFMTKPVEQMDADERDAYSKFMSQMTIAEFLALDRPTQFKMADDTRQMGVDMKQDAIKSADDIYKKMEADTALTSAARASVMQVFDDDHAQWTSKEYVAERMKLIDKIEDPKAREYALQALMVNQKLSAGEQANLFGEEARKKLEAGDPEAAAQLIKDANKGLQEAQAPQQRQDLHATVDATMATTGRTASASADLSQVKSARDENFEIGKNQDAAIAAAQLKTPMQSDDYGDEPATSPTASAAPRLTIDGRPLAAAGQLAPDSGEFVPVVAQAANDPAPEQRRPTASPSLGA